MSVIGNASENRLLEWGKGAGQWEPTSLDLIRVRTNLGEEQGKGTV